MKFAVLIYLDPALVGAVPKAELDTTLHDCFIHADAMQARGALVESQLLEDPPTARSIRVRKGKTKVTDGPFAEAKEVLGGFNIVEARDMDEAVELAKEFPWAAVGCVEVRAIREMSAVRRGVGA